MGSNHQHQNHMPDTEEFAHLLSSLSYEDSYLSQNGCSASVWGSSINLTQSITQMPHQDGQFVLGESSAISIEQSSLIVDANSSLSEVSYFTGNGSNNIDSLASNCGRISGTLRDHFTVQQQTFQAGQIYPRLCGRQGDQLPSPTFSPQMMTPAHQASVPPYMKNKKPRLEMVPEDLLRTYSLQQLSPSQIPMQLKSYEPVAATRLYQQHLERNQQQNQEPLFVPTPQRHQMQCLSPHQMPGDAQKQLAAVSTLDGSICARRLMYYNYEKRNRPKDNNIRFWKDFVEKYYSPSVKKRWCLSRYKVGQHGWNCDLCGSNLGKGFEITYDVLPRMSQIYYESGVVDEILYVDSPVERRLPSGFVLWFDKAVQQSIYKNFRVVHEGQLRIIFTIDMKIISWEFCIKYHEELVSRSLVASQVNELVEDASRFQRNSELKESEGVKAQDVVTYCNRVMAAGKNLAKNLEMSLVNEAGFSKQFVRSLQMSEVFHHMKDLIAECADIQNNKCFPIETLNRIRQENANRKYMKGRAQMPQTLSADNNIQVSNMTQTPNAREQAISNPPNYHQNFFPEEQRMTSDSYQSPNIQPSSHSAPYQSSNSSAKSSPGPSSSQKGPTTERQINDLLARIRAGGTIAKGSKTSRGSQRKLVYDPNVDPQVAEYAEPTKVGTMEIEANTSNKGFNYSSSSNSSARIFADNCMMKREPVSDDDTTSAAAHQRLEEK